MNWLSTLWDKLMQVWRDVFGGEKAKRDDAPYTKKKKNEPQIQTYNRLLLWSEQSLDQQQYALALDFANQAIDLIPNDARGYYDRAGIWYAQRLYDQALTDYGKAIHLKPNYAHAYNNRGLVWFFGFSEPEKALADFDQSLIDHNSEPHIVHGNRALALRMIGNLPAALEACNQALRLKPDSGEYVSNRAIVHYALGNKDAAFNDIATALRLDNDLLYPYVNRALIFAQQEDYPAALANLGLAQQGDPTIVHTYLARSIVYLLKSDLPAAQEQAQRAYDLQPERAQTWGHLALVAYVRGDKTAAREWWMKFVTRLPRYKLPENNAYSCDYLPRLMDIMRQMQTEFGSETTL